MTEQDDKASSWWLGQAFYLAWIFWVILAAFLVVMYVGRHNFILVGESLPFAVLLVGPAYVGSLAGVIIGGVVAFRQPTLRRKGIVAALLCTLPTMALILFVHYVMHGL